MYLNYYFPKINFIVNIELKLLIIATVITDLYFSSSPYMWIVERAHSAPRI